MIVMVYFGVFIPVLDANNGKSLCKKLLQKY